MIAVGRWARWALLAGVTALACGDGGPTTQGQRKLDAAGWKSGARLRARVASGGDGAVLFLGWHDAALDIVCAFMRTPDGELRCLPTLTSATVETAEGLFGDAGCSQPLPFDFIRGASPGERGVRVDPVATCSADPYRTVTPFIAVEPLDTWTAYRAEQRSVDGVLSTCSGPVALAGLTRAEREDPTHFVRGTEVVAGGDPALRMRQIVADDGAYQNVAFVDLAAGETCELFSDVYVGAPAACLPRGTRVFDSSTVISTSATCSPQFTRQGNGCGARVGLLVTSDAPTCPDRRHLEIVALEAEQQLSPPYFNRSGGACVERQLTQGLPQHSQRIGDPIPETAFPHPTIARAGAGRLAVDTPATPDGLALPPRLTNDFQTMIGPFWDTQLETHCWRRPTAIGSAASPS